MFGAPGQQEQSILPTVNMKSELLGMVCCNDFLVSSHTQGCSVTLADCDISSATGVGMGIEGGAPRLLRCSVHNCQRHGGCHCIGSAGSELAVPACSLPAALLCASIPGDPHILLPALNAQAWRCLAICWEEAAPHSWRTARSWGTG